METVEVVIRLPKNIYEDLFNKELQDWFIESEVNFYGLKIGKAIQNGIVLPKGHGDLKDANYMKREGIVNRGIYNGIKGIKEWIDEVPTVIEADREVDNG